MFYLLKEYRKDIFLYSYELKFSDPIHFSRVILKGVQAKNLICKKKQTNWNFSQTFSVQLKFFVRPKTLSLLEKTCSSNY